MDRGHNECGKGTRMDTGKLTRCLCEGPDWICPLSNNIMNVSSKVGFKFDLNLAIFLF